MSALNQLIDRWFSVLGFDEDSPTIVLHFDSCRNEAGDMNRRLSKLRKKYNSEIILFAVLRCAAELYKDVRIPVRETFTPQFGEFRSVLEEIETHPLNAKIAEFRMMLERFIARPNVLGEVSDMDLCEMIAEASVLGYLKDECLRSSGKPVRPETRISKDLIVCDSLGELLLKTACLPDGMVLGYVIREKAAEGFFSLMYKSNGNIVSVNDMAPEDYFGQNGNRRTDRYTENKGFSVFPYKSVLDMTFYEDGVHELIDTASVRKDKLSFDDFSIDEAIRFFVGCMLVSANLSGGVYDSKDVKYTTALMRDNLPLLESKALITVENRSIAETYRNLKLQIPFDEICAVPKGRDRYFEGRNTSADLFREFFTPDLVQEYDDYSVLIPEIRKEFPDEFIKTEEGMKEALLHYIRRNLKDRIQERIDDYFKENGNGSGGIAAFRNLISQKKDVVLRNLSVRFKLSDPEKWRKENYLAYMYGGGEKWYEDREFLPFNNPENVEKKDTSHSIRGNYGKAWQKDEGGKCNMFFEWIPRHIDEICEVLEVTEDQLPKELRGYNKNRNHVEGNSILEITDACESLQSGYTTTKEPLLYAFSVGIAMSKRQWKKTFGGNDE